jgi:ribonuclease BN (tRNA processing enzyme)
VKFRVLGCGGGVGGDDHTTCFLLDDDILIDAGSGLGSLSLKQMCALDHVFITHSHMDHIALLPVLLDSIGHLRKRPVRVYALEATIRALQEHIFNWRVWPDFTRIPRPNQPYLEFESIMVGQTLKLGARRITPIPANHVVPTVGYHLDSGAASLVFSGDTTVNDSLWAYFNSCANARYLIVESAFPNRDRSIAVASKHYCPSLLVPELTKLAGQPDIYITHMKPGETQTIMHELRESARALKPLTNGQVFEF